MQRRMEHPITVVPGAMEALQSLAKAAAETGVALRHPQDGGAAGQPDQRMQLCVGMHARELRKAGESNVWNRLNTATRTPAGGYEAVEQWREHAPDT